MGREQAHAQASNMRTDRRGIRGNVTPADHLAIDSNDLRGVGFSQASHEGCVALDRRRAEPREPPRLLGHCVKAAMTAGQIAPGRIAHFDGHLKSRNEV